LMGGSYRRSYLRSHPADGPSVVTLTVGRVRPTITPRPRWPARERASRCGFRRV
jgi:hypothetical protein